MVALLEWLRGLSRHMSTMINISDWDGYDFYVKPSASRIRRHVHFKNWYLPFFDGIAIFMTIEVVARGNKYQTDNVQCRWAFREHDSWKEAGTGEFLITQRKQVVSVSSDIIMKDTKHVLTCQLVYPDHTTEERSVATLSVRDRGDVTMSVVIPAALTAAALFVSLVALGISIWAILAQRG